MKTKIMSALFLALLFLVLPITGSAKTLDTCGVQKIEYASIEGVLTDMLDQGKVTVVYGDDQKELICDLKTPEKAKEFYESLRKELRAGVH